VSASPIANHARAVFASRFVVVVTPFLAPDWTPDDRAERERSRKNAW